MKYNISFPNDIITLCNFVKYILTYITLFYFVFISNVCK